MKNSLPLALALVAASLAPSCWAAVDAAAAEAMAKQQNCFKCHGLTKAKDGPAFKEVATKNKGKSEAEARLIKHLTTGEKAKFPDGHEEDHKVVKGSEADVKNLVQWILAQ